MEKLFEYEELDSTNNEAKRLIKEGDAAALYGAVVVARRQTGGRGRMGKGFFSPGGDSVYATFILPPPENPADRQITAAAAVAVCEAIEKTTAFKPGIKWVNDIIIEGKKVCGILTESVPGAAVLGIGVNINLDEGSLPDDLRGIAGSLTMSGEERAAFFDALAERVFQRTGDASRLMDEYRRRSVLTGNRIFVSRGEETRTATALGIADDGALIVSYDDGQVDELRTGDYSVHLAR